MLAASRLLIVAGKGGVGKTTVTAALAKAAVAQGRTVLVVDVDGRPGLAALLGGTHLTYQERPLSPGIRGRTIRPDEALIEWLTDHGMSRLSRRMLNTGALDIAATAAPGIKDLLVLGKVKQLATGHDVDLVILDAPASGHAVTFLLAARTLVDLVTAGPIHDQAAQVLELLSDADQTQVLLVTVPEETPVNELVETAFHLEDRVGVALTAVIANGVLDAPAALGEVAPSSIDGLSTSGIDVVTAAAAFRLGRIEMQRLQISRLGEALPLPRIELPFLFTANLGSADVDRLAALLA